MSSHSIKALDLLCMCVCAPQEPPRILKFNYQKGDNPSRRSFFASFFLLSWVRPAVMFREGPPSCQCRRRRVWGSRAKCEAVLCGGGASSKWHDPLGDAELSGLPCLCRWRGCRETWLTGAAGLWTVVRLKLRLHDGVPKETNSRILQQFWAAAGPQRVSLKMKEGKRWVPAAKPENCFLIAHGQLGLLVKPFVIMEANKWLNKRANNNLTVN